MTNDNNYTNELVSNEGDSAAEVEQLTSPHRQPVIDADLEADADTCSFDYAENKPSDTVAELRSQLRERSETIGRLRYDIEQLQTRRRGLEAEIRAREDVTARLNEQVQQLREALEHRDSLIGERKGEVEALESELRQRDDDLQAAIAAKEQQRADFAAEKEALNDILNIDDTGQFRLQLAEQAGRLASHEALIRDITEKYTRAEHYGDSLRRRLQESAETTEAAVRARDDLQHSHDRQAADIERIQNEIDRLARENSVLSTELGGIRETHADEMRQLRFELSEAQDTATQQELINEKLAADLVQTHGFTVELENKLDRAGEENRTLIEDLQKENRQLREQAREQEEQLNMKSEAIHALLAEIGNRPTTRNTDDSPKDEIHRPAAPAPEKDRVTRVLVGSVDGQELQFPLFKDRLTIGRTEQNDIQLKAPYISRRHAVIVSEGDATRVVDWGSKNGVFVNSTRVGEHYLSNGDIIAIGIAKFRYEERPKR